MPQLSICAITAGNKGHSVKEYGEPKDEKHIFKNVNKFQKEKF